MSNTILVIVVVLVLIVVPFWLIYKIEKRVAKKGALFTGQPTRGARTSEDSEPAIGTPDQDDMRLIPRNRFTRFLKIITITLIISAIFVYAAWLASTHPDSPLTWAFAIGVIVLVALARLKNWTDLFRNLFK